MSIEFTLPELGEGVAQADVLRVLVAPGETVRRDQPVMELETDKATVEVPSTVEGTIAEVRVKAGDRVAVGAVVLVVESAADTAEAPPPPPAAPSGSTPPADSATSAEGAEPQERPAAPAGAAESEAGAAASAPARVEFTLPELGEGVAAADVLRVLVKVGDTVAVDQPVVELETDKATVEVPSTVSGTVVEVRVDAGARVAVGGVVMVVEATAAPAVARGASSPAARQATPASEPRVSPPVEQVGDKPGMVADALEEAEAERRRAAVAARPDDRAIVAADGGAGRRAPAPASPTVRRTARELGVDIHEVKGSGPGGRISAEDIKAHVKRIMLAGGPASRVAASARAAVVLPDFAKWGPVERQPMRGIRRKTAEHLSDAWQQIPHVTQCDLADITDLEALRARFGARAEAAGGKLTVTAVALKVVASALKVFPQFNTSVDMAKAEIVQKQYVHIGVAVDTDRGLLVPVVRDVDRKNIVQIASELATAAERARSRKITLEEMEGGSFTITNLGGIGGTYFTPIVNHPEVAILGLSRARTEPVWRDGAFVPRLMLPLSLSYDHRVIDGADGIRFLRWVVEALEQPFVLSLEG